MNSNDPLPSLTLQPGATLVPRIPRAIAGVDLWSPAVEVMTDLAKIKVASIDRSAKVDQAEQYMHYLGVHMLFVVSKMPLVEGLITSTDLSGEKPQIELRRHGIRYVDLSVGDLMTPIEKVEAIDYKLILKQKVSNVVATFKDRCRNHLLVVDHGPATTVRIRGVIARSQVERQLGRPILIHEASRSLADNVVKMLT
jgi:CBS domain containing-hemolysin-like protein